MTDNNEVWRQAAVHEKGRISLAEMVSRSKSMKDFRKAGAIVTFVGVVRGENRKGEQVQKLKIEAYDEKANEVLTQIRDDLRTRPEIVDVQIHHMLGEFNVGEDLVYVLVAGSHRQSAFAVLEEAVERYKNEAPIFKKEYVTDRKGRKTAYWLSEEDKHGT